MFRTKTLIGLASALVATTSANAQIVIDLPSESQEPRAPQTQVQPENNEALPDSFLSPSQIEAKEWLKKNAWSRPIAAGDFGAISRIGFFPKTPANRQRIAALGSGLIGNENLRFDRKKYRVFRAKEIILPANKYRPVECISLIQIVRSRKLSGERKKRYDAILPFIENFVPNHPLDENCRELDPWANDGKHNNLLVQTNKGPAAYLQNNSLVAIGRQLSCSDYSNSRDGIITLTEKTKIVSTGQIGHSPDVEGKKQIKGYGLPGFRASFNEGLRQKGHALLQHSPDERFAEGLGKIVADFLMFEDPKADMFCMVAILEQGNSRWVETTKVPRYGRQPLWADIKSDPDRPVWQHRDALNDLGLRLAKELYEVQNHALPPPSATPISE